MSTWVWCHPVGRRCLVRARPGASVDPSAMDSEIWLHLRAREERLYMCKFVRIFFNPTSRC